LSGVGLALVLAPSYRAVSTILIPFGISPSFFD
jgi:hypothetical protein